MEIKLENVCYKEIFNNVNITIDSNEIIGITGKNGSGKSSLLNLIYGSYKDFSGKIYIGESVISNKTNNDKIMKEISYLRQNNEYSFIYKNILEDIKNIDGLDTAELNNLLKMFSLNTTLLYKNDFELSSGEFQKLLIVKSLLRKANLFLLDDPTKNIDEKSISSLVKILKRKKREGSTILISSTNTEFLLKVVDKVLVLDNKALFKYSEKYNFFSDNKTLDRLNLKTPQIIEFKISAENKKKIKLIYRDSINDLIKDIYRNV